MISTYTIRRELAAAIGALAFAIAPNPGTASTIDLPGIRLTRRQRSIRPWHENLRLRLRSILSNNFIHDGVVYADMAVSKSIAFIRNAAKKHIVGPTVSELAAQHKWPKAYPQA